MVAEFSDIFWTSPDGLRLHGRDYPAKGEVSGDPIICLHGLTRNARDFEDIAPWLAARGRRVLALNMRGRGRSAYDPVPAHYAIPVYAGDVMALMRDVGVSRADIVGASMGGLIGLTLAALEPNLVGGLLLNDVGTEIAPEGLARIMAYAGVKTGALTWAEAKDQARSANCAAFPAFTGEDWDRFAKRLFRADGELWRFDYDPEIAAPLKIPPDQPAPDLIPLFAAVAASHRTILVRGALSDILSLNTVEKMKAVAPGLHVFEVDGVGHAPELCEPAAKRALGCLLEQDGSG